MTGLGDSMCLCQQVLLAACVVAFGPALVLEYVPTKKVDVGDMTKAGSPSGRVSDLHISHIERPTSFNTSLPICLHRLSPCARSRRGSCARSLG